MDDRRGVVGGEYAEKQQGEEAMAAEKSGLGPKRLRKASNGQKVEFVLESGSLRTVAPPEVAKGMTMKKGRSNGGFRVANGQTIPNLGGVELEGLGEKGNVKLTAQVAAVTKPLASVFEMTESGDLVILHRTGGIVKRLSRNAEEKIRDIVQAEEGPAIVLQRKSGAFRLDTEVKGSGNDEGFQVPKTSAKTKKNREMDVDEAGIEKSYHDALWEDSPEMEDDITGLVEEEMKCQGCSDWFHRR